MRKTSRAITITLLLITSALFASLPLSPFNTGYGQTTQMTFASDEKIRFTSDDEMTFRSDERMTFGSNISMSFGTNISILFNEWLPPPDGFLAPCDLIQIVWPAGYIPPPCSWWEILDNGSPTGLEFHVDYYEPPDTVHVDMILPQGPSLRLPLGGGPYSAVKKVQIVEPCSFFVVHWPSHWWPQPCSWWEIIDPDTGELTGYEFHVDWTNESCEFHVDRVIPEPWGPWTIGAYEVWARQKIPDIKPCDGFVVEDPVDWWPEPCTWWEILDPITFEPTGLEFHVDWTNESCEFHVDEVLPGEILNLTEIFFPPPVSVVAERKITDIVPCDWYVVVDPPTLPGLTCTWWEILDDSGAPTGYEFHIDEAQGVTMFHVDTTLPPTAPITIPPTYTVTVKKKIDTIQPCDGFIVDDPSITPVPCSWWEILDPTTGDPTGIEFHVDDSITQTGWFHVDIVVDPGAGAPPPTYMLEARRKTTDINPCDWFEVVDPSSWVPEPCSWWVITDPPEWEGIIFHVDNNDGISKFHIDFADDPAGNPPDPPPLYVTAELYEQPPVPWYMKRPFVDYAPSGMPDFDQRQWSTYNWSSGGTWSHCGPAAVANSLWWLDSEFEAGGTPPPTISDSYSLVESYNAGGWDDHDQQNVQPLIEHLAWLMDTDGIRTGVAHLGTNVFDMQAGITHYLSWSGVNPIGDVDGDGNVTQADLDIVNAAFGSNSTSGPWDLRADIYPATITYPPVTDNTIDINDVSLVTANMGLNGSFYEHTVPAPAWDIIVEEVLRCQDVVLLLVPWMYDDPMWYRYDEGAHFVTVAGLNASTMEIVFSDPIHDNAEAGGNGTVPFPHLHIGPEPPYTTHNDAKLVSHDMYHVIWDECPGGPLTIPDFPGGAIPSPAPYPIWKIQIEFAVITSPYEVPAGDVAVIDVNTSKTGCTPMPTVGQGQTADVYATVENQGSTAETFNVTAYANTTAIGEQQITLNPGENATLTFVWDTTAFAKGDYTISAEAELTSDVDPADNTYIDGTIRVTTTGDINGDGTVDIFDAINLAGAFGKQKGDPGWNPNADLNGDGVVDIFDAILLAGNFGS